METQKEAEVMAETCTIDCLPNELILMILVHGDCRDIMNFASTCKRFNELVNNDQTLWKVKFKQTMPAEVQILIEKHGGADWMEETKRYFVVKERVIEEVSNMSSVYFWRTTNLSLEDVRNFFEIALSHNLAFFYTVCTLQYIIWKCNNYLQRGICIKPYTLTEMNYAKIALRHLFHTFLAVKWVKRHVTNELSPIIVQNFFIQWLDPDHMHTDEDVETKVQEFVLRLEALLGSRQENPDQGTVKEQIASGSIKARDVVAAISRLLYSRVRTEVTQTANMDTLDLYKILNFKTGHPTGFGAIYQTLAQRLAIDCELIAFPNHLFLEWRDHSPFRPPERYTIDLETGAVKPKRRCPFSQNAPVNKYTYYPDLLLQFIYASFQVTMGTLKNWYTQNALFLLDFLGTSDSELNPYRNFLPYLLDLTHLPSMNEDLNLKYLTDAQLEIMRSLANLNPAIKPVCREPVVRKRDITVKYAVGLICTHRKYEYICVIRGWDLTCAVEWKRRMYTDSLQHGLKQPFYHVIAADQSDRYVAQENLKVLSRPVRVYHLEDCLGREFSHFDGYSYIPNKEKQGEYPDDCGVIEVYRQHFISEPPKHSKK